MALEKCLSLFCYKLDYNSDSCSVPVSGEPGNIKQVTKYFPGNLANDSKAICVRKI